MDREAWQAIVQGGHKESDTAELLTHTYTPSLEKRKHTDATVRGLSS